MNIFNAIPIGKYGLLHYIVIEFKLRYNTVAMKNLFMVDNVILL